MHLLTCFPRGRRECVQHSVVPRSFNPCAAISLLFLVVFSATLCRRLLYARGLNALCLIDLAHLQSEFLFELLYKLTCSLVFVPQKLGLILSKPNTAQRRLLILGPAFPKYLEPENLGLIAVDLRWKDHCGSKMLKEYLREGATKHAPVNI